MARWLLMLVVVALAGFIPVTAFAQDPELGNREREFAGAINDPLTIESNETVAMIVGIHNEATIDGTVTDVAFIIDGTLIVNGTVNGSIASFSSHVIVNAGAVVNDISLQNSTIEIAPGAQVRGQTQVHGTFFLLEWWSSPVFALVMWVLTTLFVVAGGIIFTLAAGRQFPIYVNATSRHIGQNILRMIMLWIGIPIVVIVLNNEILAYQQHGEEWFMHHHSDASDLGPVDHAAIARACGCFGERVASPEEFAPALQRALDSGLPAVVDVMTDPDAHAPLSHYLFRPEPPAPVAGS